MGAVFSQQEYIPCKNLLLSPLDSPVLGIRRFLYMFGPGGSQYIERRHHAFGPPVPTQSISPSILYFYDVVLLLILVHLFWGIGACILAPGGPRKAQWGHRRAFCAGSKMDCFGSLIEMSSEKTSCGTPRISAIPEICPWESARSAAECRRRARCAHTLKTAACLCIATPLWLCWPSLLMNCDNAPFLCCFALLD